MQSTEEGSINLLSTIRCPKVLKLIQKKLPEKSIGKIKDEKPKEESTFYRPPHSELKKAVSGEKYPLKVISK
jgi:hypothetical protein